MPLPIAPAKLRSLWLLYDGQCAKGYFYVVKGENPFCKGFISSTSISSIDYHSDSFLESSRHLQQQS